MVYFNAMILLLELKWQSNYAETKGLFIFFFSLLTVSPGAAIALWMMLTPIKLNFRDNIFPVRQALWFLGRQMRVLAHPCSLQILYMDIEFVKFHLARDWNYVLVRNSLSSTCEAWRGSDVGGICEQF